MKKILEQWGILQKESTKETGGPNRYLKELLRDAFNFTILAFILGNFASAIDVIQGRKGPAEFWGQLLSPAWIFWFFIGIPISWVWRKSGERFGKPASCAIFAFFFFGLCNVGGFIIILMEQR